MIACALSEARSRAALAVIGHPAVSGENGAAVWPLVARGQQARQGARPYRPMKRCCPLNDTATVRRGGAAGAGKPARHAGRNSGPQAPPTRCHVLIDKPSYP